MNAPARQGPGYPLLLLGLFGIVFIVLGIAPAMREDWMLENVLVVAAIGFLCIGYRRLRLSNGAYTLLFVFGVFHEIGSHYQYSLVPYDAWIAALGGGSLLEALPGFERNQYDRFVHFLYGLLVTPAASEMIAARVRPRGAWMFLLPVTFMMSHAVVYELFEWLAASVFGGDLGEAYLGTQGDTWDAQKDMALAMLGSIIVQPVWMARQRRHGQHRIT